MTIKTAKKRATPQDLSRQDAHGRTSDKVGAGVGLYRLFHVTDNAKGIVRQMGVLKFI